MLNKLLTTVCVVGFFVAVTVPFQGCKKDVPPTLILTVTDTADVAMPSAEVRVWYGADATNGVTNDDNYDQRGFTDSEGKVTFSFPYSAILDINAFAVKTTPNPPFPDIVDTLWGSTAVKVHTKRQRSKENIVEETVEVY